ncbi:hypothetical protein MB901379_02158 [Mycobacterium basiliense]|uniref:Uncharacterized protein n=1 Tax=Mycobacterium basiliense TaxID=2094119 RepID=A0A447GDP4_9MYCO|nr:hypothetical protein MB901379_02158 [Mycobacterium basiliense]
MKGSSVLLDPAGAPTRCRAGWLSGFDRSRRPTGYRRGVLGVAVVVRRRDDDGGVLLEAADSQPADWVAKCCAVEKSRARVSLNDSMWLRAMGAAECGPGEPCAGRIFAALRKPL